MHFFEQNYTSGIENVYRNEKTGISIDIKREDNIHPEVSGNKFRKLKYNILKAIENNHHSVLTYGGAYSNHIAATAAAAKLHNLKSIGIIRGDEIEDKFHRYPEQNSTLAFAKSQGMTFHFINREKYKQKDTIPEIEKLKDIFGDFYRIPEGGTNALAVRGCEDILNQDDDQYQIIACCVGTGGTLAGLVNASQPKQHVFGFSALKGHQHHEILQYVNKNNFSIFQDHEFGGYAKTNEKLIEFINAFFHCTSIKLDPIYTGKMMFKLFKMVEQGKFERNTKILVIHSGGLQGVKGFNILQKSKNRTALVFQ